MSEFEKCPKCGQNSLLKTPEGRVMLQPQSLYIADNYHMHCLICGYRSETISVNTPDGDKWEKSTWIGKLFYPLFF